MSGVTFWIMTPSQPRVTCPFSFSCGTISFARLIGMAKPMPMLPPLRLKIAVLMPTTSPLRVEQRAAGVARIDGGVGLDEVVVRALVDVPPERADDAGGHRVLEAEGVADRDHPLRRP